MTVTTHRSIADQVRQMSVQDADLIAHAFVLERSEARAAARDIASLAVLDGDLSIEPVAGLPGPVGDAARDAALAYATFGSVPVEVTTKLLWAWVAPEREATS